jgi:hypothetical protein
MRDGPQRRDQVTWWVTSQEWGGLVRARGPALSGCSRRGALDKMVDGGPLVCAAARTSGVCG